MVYDPEKHHRHSIRLKYYDYSRGGAYFVTVCAWQRECLFGEIVAGAMQLNDLGRVVAEEWQRTSEIRPNVQLDVYAIMPNHVHAIFVIHESVGATPLARPGATCNHDRHCNETRAHDETRATQRVAPTGPVAGSVGAIMAQFKSIVTKRINIMRNNPRCPVWQRNYYERVVRDENEMTRAREYVVNNPLQWELDRENPANTIEP